MGLPAAGIADAGRRPLLRAVVLVVALAAVLAALPARAQERDAEPQRAAATGSLGRRYEVLFRPVPADPATNRNVVLKFRLRDAATGADVPLRHVAVTVITPDGQRFDLHAYAPISQLGSAGSPELELPFVFSTPGKHSIVLPAVEPAQTAEKVEASFSLDVAPSGVDLRRLTGALAGLVPVVALKWLHLLAAAAWVVSFPLFAFVLAPAAPRDGQGGEMLRRARAGLMAVFAASAVLLPLTGFLRSMYHGIAWGSLDLFFRTTYGLVLVAKLLLFLVMLDLAAVLSWRVVPRYIQAHAAGGPGAAGAGELAALRRQLLALGLAEAGLGLVALLLAATFPQLHVVR